MILDGDILKHFEEELELETRWVADDEFSDYSVRIPICEEEVKVIFSLSKEDGYVLMIFGFQNPVNLNYLTEAMEEFNHSSLVFKTYYEASKETVIVEGFTLVTEENVIDAIDYMIEATYGIDKDALDKLYYAIYYASEDEDEDEEDDDLDISKDLAELQALLMKK